jgi:hypothetical protein
LIKLTEEGMIRFGEASALVKWRSAALVCPDESVRAYVSGYGVRGRWKKRTNFLVYV